MPLPPAGQSNPGSKTQVASGMFAPEHAHAFFKLVCICLFLLPALLESSAPFHEELVYTKEQARKQTGSKGCPEESTTCSTKKKKKQAPPTHLIPHPPHQWEAPWPSTALSVHQQAPAPRHQAKKIPGSIEKRENCLPLHCRSSSPRASRAVSAKKMRKRSSILPWQISSQAVLMSQISHAR